MIVFLKKLLYEPALFFGVATSIVASAAGVWSNDVLAFIAAELAIAGGFVIRAKTVTKRHQAEQPNGFVDLSNN